MSNPNMTVDELIQEWMSEDKYLVKLTKRQRSIASNKLRFKLAPYVREKYTSKVTKRQRSIASKRLSNKLLHCDDIQEVETVVEAEVEPKVEAEVEAEVESEVNPKVSEVLDTKVKTEPYKRKADLIHEWMNEDQLLTKYTKRQKVILCKKLIQKLDTDKDQLERALEESSVSTQELEAKVARYQKAYRALLRTAYSTRSADRFCKMIWVIWMTLIIRFVVNTFIASIPPGWCSATALPQTEPYKTLGLP